MRFNREDSVAVVDVSPGGASVAIFSSSRTAANTLYASASSNLSLEAHTVQQAKASIGIQIKEAAERAAKMYATVGRVEPITKVYAIVHAPWTTSRFMSAKTQFESEIRVDDRHVGDIAKQSLENSDLDRSRLLEATVVRISVNGYPTPDPAGARASSLEVTSLASVVEADVLASVESALHASFPVADIAWRSAIRSRMPLGAVAPIRGDFLMIDMGNDNTHIASIREGVLEQMVVPEGTRTILARAAGGRAPDEVLGYMRMIARDACSTEACEAVKKALAAAEPELVRIFGEAIANIATKKRVPNDVVLCAHPDLVEWLTALFARIDFAQFTVTSLPLSVHTPETLDIGRWVAGARTYDPATIGAALVNIETRA